MNSDYGTQLNREKRCSQFLLDWLKTVTNKVMVEYANNRSTKFLITTVSNIVFDNKDDIETILNKFQEIYEDNKTSHKQTAEAMRYIITDLKSALMWMAMNI